MNTRTRLSEILLKRIDTFLNPKFENKFIYYLLTFGIGLIGIPAALAYKATLTHEASSTSFMVEVGNSGNALAMTFGVIIVLISCFLFYKNNLSAPKPIATTCKIEDEKRKRDIENLSAFMSQINTREMDEFIDRGKYSQIYMRGLHYVEGVLGIISDSSFHIYDETLKAQIEDFGQCFDKATSFGEFFRPVASPNLQRFARDHEFSDIERLEEAERSYLNSIHNLEISYKNLITTVKNKYLEIDINEANRLALEDYASYEK